MLLKVYKSRVWLLLFMLMPFVGNAQIPGLPPGWGFTLNPTSATYAIPTDVAFNGVDALVAGDWVGAFYMDNGVMECGGAVEWDGTNNVAIVVFGNDTLVAPDKNGFSEGEPIHWMVYRGVEDECVKAYDAASAEFNWTNGALAEVASFGVCEVCLDINLATGFQFISSNVVPANLNFQTIMTDVLDNLAFARNSTGAQLIKFGPVWVNQIGNWNITQGYQAKMNGSDVLTICGEPVDPFTPIDLATGFSFISFLPQAPINAQVALGSILDNMQFARNDAGAQLIKFGPVWVNQIGNLIPGKGYQIKMNAPDQLIYPAADGVSSPSGNSIFQSSDTRTGHFDFEGGDATNLWSIFMNTCTLAGMDIEAGDEIAIFDGVKMVGQWTFNGPVVPNTFQQSIVAYKTLNSGPGYTPGNAFTLKFWDQSAGVEVTDFTYEFTDPFGYGWYTGDVFPAVDNSFTVADFNFQMPVVQYNVSTSANPLEGGTTAGDGLYDDGTDATVTATANEGWMFVNWTVDGSEVSTLAEYTFTVTEDVSLVANFEVMGGPAPVLLTAEPSANSVNLTWEAIPEVPLAIAKIDNKNYLNDSRTGHFNFEGGDATNLWSIFMNTCTLAGMDVEAGDEIAIFDGVKMVGQWTFDGPVLPNTFQQSIVAYKTLNSGPGYTPGNAFTLKFWDESAGVEVTDFTYEFTDPFGYGWYTGDVFPTVDNSFTVADFNFVSITPYVPTFNVYQDGMLIAEGVEGSSYLVEGLDDDTEYCFYVTQILEDDSESDASNTLCATTPPPSCEDVVINMWPDAPADVCFGTLLDIDFSGVEILNAVSYEYSVEPAEAGNFDGDYFLLSDMYVGGVTINLNTVAVAPCNNASESLSFTVLPLPEVTLVTYEPLCEGSDEFALYGGLPEGGTYYLFGEPATLFDPSMAGEYELEYVYTDANGCTNSATGMIVVNALPEVTLVAYEPVCAGSDAFELYGGLPEGGEYYVDGEMATMFDPAMAGVYVLEYMYTDMNGCSASATGEIVVNALPEVTLVAYEPVCAGSDAFELYGGLPEGGEYYVDGEMATMFDPAMAGVYVLEYMYTDMNGCSASATGEIVVNALPEVTLVAYEPVCAGSEAFDLYGGLPEGGEYYVDGEMATMFDPAMAGVYVLEYMYTDMNGCSASATGEIVVNALPDVVCPEDMTVAITSLPLTLSGATPEGGEYSGVGVVDGVFEAELGMYEITYSYTDMNGCSNSCSFMIEVVEDITCYDAEINNFPESQEDVCEGTALVIDFSGVEVLNAVETEWLVEPVEAGEYLGTDFVLANDFAGMVTLTLNAYAQEPCMDATASLTFTVNALPEVTLVAYEPVCAGSEAFDLYGGLPEGGEYYVDGEPATMFDPAMAGVYVVEYMYTDMNGCSASATGEIVVNALPEVSCPEDFAVCIDAEPWMLYGGMPEGGEYSGEFVVDGMFDPMAAGVGEHEVTYTYDNEFGCSASCTFMITVNALPEVTLEAYEPVCAGSEAFELYGGLPEGGEYYVDGEPATMFDPAVAGTYAVIYMYTDMNGCSASATGEILVNALPEVTLEAYEPVCAGSDAFDLYGGLPEGGEYYVDGEPATMFDPAVAGTYAVEYMYTDMNGCSATATGEIVVNPLPWLSLELSATEVCLGETVEGMITGPDDGAYPYDVEYSINGVTLMDQILSPLTVLPLAPDMAGLYTLEVLSVIDANGCTAMEVEGVELTVLPLTEITMDPMSVAVEWGQAAEFAVEAVNATGYQWYLNGEMIDGATDATYSIEAVVVEDGGDYYCVATGDCGQATSETATLTVLPWTQTIDLLGPINGFSTYLDLLEDDVATMFNPIVANVLVVDFVSPNFTWNPNGLDYTFNEEKGALVNLSGGYPTSLDVMGYPTLGTTLDLAGGVTNYLPVWSQNVVLADDVFGPIAGDVYAVFSQDYSGYWFPAYNMYTLEYLVPGSSYIVLLTSDATVSFDVPAVDAAPGYADLPRNITTWEDATLTGSQHNIVITADAMSQLEVGDVIGAFNEYGQITGMVEIKNLRDNTMLRTYGDNPLTQRNEGFVDGDLMTIKVWRNGEEMTAQATFDADMPNQNVFAKNGISTITNLNLSITSINDLTADLTADLYPNPATDVVNVSTNFEIKNLKVVNYVGQVVFDQNVNQVNFQINTSNFVSGMYFVQIETNEGAVITKRLTVK